jgi:hypothetical protein
MDQLKKHTISIANSISMFMALFSIQLAKAKSQLIIINFRTMNAAN